MFRAKTSPSQPLFKRGIMCRQQKRQTGSFPESHAGLDLLKCVVNMLSRKFHPSGRQAPRAKARVGKNRPWSPIPQVPASKPHCLKPCHPVQPSTYIFPEETHRRTGHLLVYNVLDLNFCSQMCWFQYRPRAFLIPLTLWYSVHLTIRL